MKRVGVAAVAGVLAVTLTATGSADAHETSFRVQAGQTLRGHVPSQNDTVVSHTSPSHGALQIGPDGSFTYVPDAGFTGTDSFTFTTSDAVSLYSTDVPPLATIGGITITGGAYGSALTPVPGKKGEYYGLTDRGPNVDGPNGEKIEPLPEFTPAIGRFQLVNGKAVLKQSIPLRAADGSPYNGQVNPQASTGETIVDLDGDPLPASPNGYDSEGLVALGDGTFWVSDEYGPFVTHFDSRGRAIQRLSPFDGSLPAELANRVVNKGMEGLTITPDGRTLIGIMQSALQQPDLTKKPANVAPVRIVTYDLRSHATHEYLYLLDNPKDNSGAVSEITALNATTFLVDERDGKMEPGAFKKLTKISLDGATDVGPKANVKGATYDATKGGLLVGGKSIEALVGTDDTATTTTDLANAGITPVRRLDGGIDLGGLLTGLDPAGGFFGHDKVEGVATPDGGRTIVVSNDSDFGIDGITNSMAPYALHAKILPNGKQDDGEILTIDTSKLDHKPDTVTVRITVTGHR
ncbi:MAG TPA: esterase-like activity of phytase family protein [Amycolatopsis sp.]|nr:esterase-like activity of phytase family protein [Amycolatopsis sp.]